jgi:YVTN family beta-propeller protein
MAIPVRIALISVPAMTSLLLMQGCDPIFTGPDPMKARYGDPPTVYTFLNSTTGWQTAVRLEFPSFTSDVKVTNPSGFTFLRQGGGLFPALLGDLLRPPVPRGGGTLDPDPDEHQFDPWDCPDPEDDFPLPDPPELPDPFDDPFDGLPELPEPPPFPDDEMDISDYSTGSLSILDSGGEQLGYNAPGTPRAANAKPRVIRVLASIQVGPKPAGIVTSPDKTKLYVAVGGNGTIAVIDRKSRTITSRITLPAGVQPYALAITPDGSKLFTGEFLRGTAAAYSIDLPSGTSKELSGSGSFISQAIVTPDGTQVWMISYFGVVQIYDVLTNAYINGLQIDSPWNVAFNASGTRAYVTNGASGVPGSVAVVDTATLQTIATIPVGTTPRNIRLTPSGRHAFVTNYDSTFISQIDVRGNRVIRSIPIGGTGASAIGFAHN